MQGVRLCASKEWCKQAGSWPATNAGWGVAQPAHKAPQRQQERLVASMHTQACAALPCTEGLHCQARAVYFLHTCLCRLNVSGHALPLEQAVSCLVQGAQAMQRCVVHRLSRAVHCAGASGSPASLARGTCTGWLRPQRRARPRARRRSASRCSARGSRGSLWSAPPYASCAARPPLSSYTCGHSSRRGTGSCAGRLQARGPRACQPASCQALSACTWRYATCKQH